MEENEILKDLSKITQDALSDVNNVFANVIKDTTYSTKILTEILVDVIPETETIVSIIDPKDLIYIEILAQILGDIEAISGNMNKTSSLLEKVVSKGGVNISVDQVKQVSGEIDKAYEATKASIKDIEKKLRKIFLKSVVTIKKS